MPLRFGTLLPRSKMVLPRKYGYIQKQNQCSAFLADSDSNGLFHPKVEDYYLKGGILRVPMTLGSMVVQCPRDNCRLLGKEPFPCF